MPFKVYKKNSKVLSSNKSTRRSYNNTEVSSLDLLDKIKNKNIISADDLQTEDFVSLFKNIDDYNTFFSSQQLENIDYEDFSQHVFFDSASSKAIYSINKILNFPYDKDQINLTKELNDFDGYTSYLLENKYPSFLGYQKFTGNEKVVVYDKQGYFLNDSNSKKVGLLNPKRSKFSFNFWVKIEDIENNFLNEQVLFKKFIDERSNQKGYLCFFDNINTDRTQCDLNFLIYNKESYNLSKCKVDLNQFVNVTINIFESGGLKNRKSVFFINGNKVNTTQDSSRSNEIDDKNFNLPSTKLVFGNAESLSLAIPGKRYNFTNFKGSLDEFKFYTRHKSEANIKKEMHKNVFSQKNLKLYFRFNEPAGSYQNSNLIIDYSGNKLHGLLLDNNNDIISDTTLFKINENTPLNLEQKKYSPVINGAFSSVLSLRSSLIEEGNEYDLNNPNIIFKLMPQHYFTAASDFQNLPVYVNLKNASSENNTDTLRNIGIENPANNNFVNIVLIWARFFDQLKVYIDSITKLLDVDYDNINEKRILGLQLPLLCKTYGIEFKEIFTTITKEKLEGNNLLFEDVRSDLKIRKIQNILWQRFLINTQDYVRSKGTMSSIKSAFNSFGIDYTKLINFREYSNSNNIILSNKISNDFAKKILSFNFSNSNFFTSSVFPDPLVTSSFSNNKPYIEISNFKNRMHLENSAGVDITPNSVTDTFSLEFFFSFNSSIEDNKQFSNNKFNVRQNLFRIDDNSGGNIVNAYFLKDNSTTSIGNIIISIEGSTLIIEEVNLFDLPKYICLTRNKDDSLVTYNLYYKNLGKQPENIIIKSISKTVSVASLNENNLSTEELNFRVGSFKYLGDLIPSSNTEFQGEVISIRTWNKILDKSEVVTHSKDLENTGLKVIKDVKSKLTSNFILDDDSFTESNGQSLIEFKNQIDASNKVPGNNDGNRCFGKINQINVDSDNIINQKELLLKRINTNIDSLKKENRVNILSYENSSLKDDNSNFNEFPIHEVPEDFIYNEEERLEINMSIAKVVNDDIGKLIVDINNFNSLITANVNLNSYSYKELEILREEYFSKFSDSKLTNYSSIQGLFRYFDNIMTNLIYDCIPDNVYFTGFNMIYESHILERHKYEHKNKFSNVHIIDSPYSFSKNNDTKYFRSSSYNLNRKMNE